MNRRLVFCLVVVGGLVGPSLAGAQQVCPSGVPRGAPDSRYEVIEDVVGEKVIKDVLTDLQWQRCPVGLSGDVCTTGTAGAVTWSGALTAANASTYGGKSDWRLPNVIELQSLVETGCANPAINPVFFPNMPFDAAYWTSTTVPNTLDAHVIEFANGLRRYTSFFGRKSLNRYVRLVRAGRGDEAFASERPPAFFQSGFEVGEAP
ncbi:DUF1566 domain-containing protein [Pseudomarimonas arenosa]|uniref:DUF1566 domain-containing protein n=1 Tax=Pseudomarimonas arenosa TaxID=2774145 RepID=A0AAW3ZQ99_9GAMM|nr:DUF1566 domain-containing protein [Pseudomarimonas arenosa]MBD8527282.1 DUF1566 domain-containing protein [Pseudomarimonas arenosa]